MNFQPSVNVWKVSIVGKGRAIAQAVSCRFLTSEARVRSQYCPYRQGWAKWATAQGLAYLTPVLVLVGIAIYLYIVAVVCLICVLL
jgi:hypothetical protein